jgi:hypothetical protein
VLIDDLSGGETIDADVVAELPLRRLSLSCATVSRPLPKLVELVVAADVYDLQLQARHLPALEELVVINRSTWTTKILPGFGAFIDFVRGLPALRRLRVIGEPAASMLVGELSAVSTSLELVDVSHGNIDAGSLARLRSWDRPPQVLALGTSPRTAVNAITPNSIDDAWLMHRLRTEGRDAIRRIPGAGVVLYNLGTNLLIETPTEPARAIPILDVAATLPSAQVGTYPLANAAIAHEKAMQLDEAELRAREALLRAPREPNFHAILIDALRRTGRLAEAEAALPAAYKAIARPPVYGHRGAAGACLLDCMFVLAQAGRAKEVIALANKFEKYVTADCQSVIALAQLALGKLRGARAAMKLANKAEEANPVVHHARAAMHAANNQRTQMRAEIDKARAANYTELAWLERDPLLSADAASSRAASRRAPRRARRR